MRTHLPDEQTLDREQALYRFLVDSLTEYAVFAVSRMGIVISWNAGAEKTFGYAAHEIVGKPFNLFFTAQDNRIGAPQEELASALAGRQTQHDRWHVRKNGTRFWGTNTVQPLFDAGGDHIGFTKLVRDTTASHDALERLTDSEQQLRLLVESVRDYAIFSLSPDGKIVTWSAGATKVFGYAAAEAIGRDHAMLFSPADLAAGIPAAELLDALTQGAVDTERWQLRKGGSRFRAQGKTCRLEPDAGGGFRGFVVVVHDVTQHHIAAQDLRRRAQFDELTELPNRRTFYEHVQRAIGSIKRHAINQFAVLFIDLDHFKAINDEFGHIVADKVLATTARRLEHCVRTEDIVSRIGGDEFAILLTGIRGIDDATDAAHRIGVEMRKSVRIEGRDVRATTSIGIALGTQRYERPEDVLRDADAAMYAAKVGGRSRAFVFDAATPQMDVGGIDLTADLRHAVERGQLRIVYQPIVKLSDRSRAGYEALIRWQHPVLGLLSPLEFIGLAEKSDLISAIDRWMLHQACGQLADWRASGWCGSTAQMSVNVSGREFIGDELLPDLRAILASRALPPACLRIEITESAAMDRSVRADSIVCGIRNLGVSVDIDDFGTGYSSLGGLQNLTVDGLKIASTFVANLTPEGGTEFVETIVGLAHRLRSIAIAEGIEREEQYERLVALGCDFGQGFLFGAPLEAQAACGR